MKLYLVGGGRNPHTRELRRAARFSRRVFRIGDLTIRPNRRVVVTTEFCAKYFKEIVAHITDGTLIVQHDADRFVTADDLRALLGRAPATVDTASEETSNQETEETQEETKAEETSEETSTEEAQEDTKSEETKAEESIEKTEEASTEETTPEETKPAAEPPEETKAEAAEVAEEPKESGKTISEDLLKLTKKELLALCAERGIPADSKMNNAKLIALLS